ncbi:MAG: hypothetical protein E7418_05670 [Ruminococcaceae bacterium]|nr:hypothetical protein [Oscillospiraceae bacterium]
MFSFDEKTKRFLRDKLRMMLSDKKKLDARYKKQCDMESLAFQALATSLSAEQKDLLETYRNAVIDRESQGLYFAYFVGVKDGVTLHVYTDHETFPFH